MSPRQVNQLATIATRYTELKEAAKQVRDSITALSIKTFSDTLTIDEEETLRKAREIANKIAGTYSTTDAIKYFQKIQDEQK